jgi:hypothetical protein
VDPARRETPIAARGFRRGVAIQRDVFFVDEAAT